MTLGMTIRLVLTGLCLLGATGCVSYPIAKQFREQAQATKSISFLTICENPDAYKGRMVIWGGRIIKTVNETNGEFVTVLQAPLDDQERPESTKLSQGRFIVKSSGFLDPEVYRTGSKITIAGELSGTEIQNVGNRSYAFPLVMLRDVYFWRPESAVPASSVYYVAPPYWGWNWYGSYWPYDDGFHGYYNSDLDRDWGRREHERR
jgi:outer membrane lipoprotein